MIAYNNDFQLMLILTIAVMPLILLMRNSKPKPGAPPAQVE